MNSCQRQGLTRTERRDAWRPFARREPTSSGVFARRCAYLASATRLDPPGFLGDQTSCFGNAGLRSSFTGASGTRTNAQRVEPRPRRMQASGKRSALPRWRETSETESHCAQTDGR